MNKTDLCHPATVAEGQGAVRDKIARYLGHGRTTIERAGAVVEAARGGARTARKGSAFAMCAKPA